MMWFRHRGQQRGAAIAAHRIAVWNEITDKLARNPNIACYIPNRGNFWTRDLTLIQQWVESDLQIHYWVI